MVGESAFQACKHFLECVQQGRDAATSGRDNLKTYAICEAAYESAATGRAVQPAEV
jgi:predicted dehydrogenase